MKQIKSNIVGRITGILFLLVLFTMFSCTNDQNEYREILEPIDFGMIQTRATDASFENGDKIGIYAIESGKDFLASGNYADNKQYIYQDGKFQPVSANERIFGVKGKSYLYHAYYPYRSGINPSDVVFDAISTTTKNRPLWSINNRSTGGSVQFAFTNVFSLIEVNINETADKIVSGSILDKLSSVSMNMCNNTLTTVQQSHVSVPLSLYTSSNSISTFRGFLPASNTISIGDELFSFQTSSSESKKYYANKDITTIAGEKNVFSLTLLEEYLIKATSTAGGSITGDATAWANGKKFKNGQQCSLPFQANTGYFFDGIYENNVKQNCTTSPYVFNVTKARTLEVRFKQDVTTYGNWIVSVSADPTTIAAAGGTSSITATATRDIYTNGTKTGTDTGTPTLSASGTGFTLNGKTLTASNNTGAARSCTITATQGNVSETCTVTQNAVETTYGNWIVSVSADPTAIAAAGGTSFITATATRDVLTNGVKTSTETGNPTLSISGTGFSLSGKTLTASNNTGSSRSCTITATHAGVSKTCTVTQNAVEMTYGNWVVTVNANPTTIAATGGTSSITATATRDVFTNGTKTGTDTGNPILSASGSGFSLSGKTLTASNNTGAARTCTITATQGNVSKMCTVTQDAAEITYDYSFSVSPTFLSFSSKGETKSFTVISLRVKVVNGISSGVTENVGYTTNVSGTNANGFTVSGTSVVASENPMTDFRDGTLTITQNGSGKTATITLEQERKINIDTEI